MKNIGFFFFLPFFFVSCSIFYHTQQPDKEFLRIINTSSQIKNNQLIYNGIYQLSGFNNSTEKIDSIRIKKQKNHIHEVIINPIIFFKNGYVLLDQALYGDFFCVYRDGLERALLNNKYTIKSSWGVYEINDNIIKCVAYVGCTGRGGKALGNFHIAHFEGRIDSTKNILDWHMVSPYPKLTRLERRFKENLEYIEYAKTPKDFAFKDFPVKTRVDSTKVWINKYKKKD